MTGPRAIGVVEALALVEETGLVVPREELPGLIARVEGVKAALFARLVSVASAPPLDDRLLGVEEAAEMLGLKKSAIYERADQYPFTVREGRCLRFSHHGIQEYLARRRGKGGRR